MVKILLNNGRLISVYQGEADQLIKKGLASYPSEEKAIKPDYDNKMIDPPVKNKRKK